MGLGFTDTQGQAQKVGLEYLKIEFGENRFRLVGDIRARYCYWKELKGNNIPVECLSFNPEKEVFDNIEKDWFKHYFPDARCVWSYVMQAINSDGELRLFGMKRKLFDQIQTAAKSLGDPTATDETGYILVVEKKKTGSNRFNVEYTLDVLATKDTQGPLSEKELEALEGIKQIDKLVPRISAEDQKKFIESAWIDTEETNVDKDAIDELNADAPF